MTRYLLIITTILIFALCSCTSDVAEYAPANSPGILKIEGNRVTLDYGGNEIMEVTVDGAGHDFTIKELKDTRSEKVSHIFTITSTGGNPLRLTGLITAGLESIACEADRKIRGTQIVRHTFGPSRNLLNRAVYDRTSDWLLSADQSYTSDNLTVIPEETDTISKSYRLEMTGNQVTFRFRPHYFQKHRGLAYFEPWKYQVWKGSVAGWCSWFAFKTGITEENIKQTADIISEKLRPYGLEYLQIDDGYQQPGGQPEKWIVPNEKFPSGLEDLASYIKSRGLKPGIWTNVAFHDSSFVGSHKQWFVTEDDGTAASGQWVGYLLDGSNLVTLDSLISPVYNYFRETGWEYYKLDALRHLLFEGYNSHSNFFEKKNMDREKAFRNVVERVRRDTGREHFLLSCWGVLPAVVGLADGCRIGNDGFGYAALTQYNSFNNIVWRNDPDHIELTPSEAYRSCMVTSMTGSLFMVTDKPDVYRTPIIEPAQKSLPVLFTMPGQLFDIDPSRSMMLDRTMTEMSGSGEREADGSSTSPFDLFLLELNMPWESWAVLGRTGTGVKEISLDEMGLKKGSEYLVYEFWSRKFYGTTNDKLVFEEINPAFNCQLFCFREKKDHPQVLATDRHISCGATDLSDVMWAENILSGKSKTIKGDEYTIVLYEPDGFRASVFKSDGGRIIADTKKDNIHSITIVTADSENIAWELVY